ncbi:early nodulin-like protein 3 [Wolffia australiana]
MSKNSDFRFFLYMERRMFMSLWAMVGFMFLLMVSSDGRDFIVGGKDGWVPNPSENFSSWAERNRFQINDTLVFVYNKGEDSVLLVTEENYLACDTTNPIEERKSGVSVMNLRRSGVFFFISGVPERCQRGEKLVVVVLGLRHRRYSAPSSPPLAPPLARKPAAVTAVPPPGVAGDRPALSSGSAFGSAPLWISVAVLCFEFCLSC